MQADPTRNQNWKLVFLMAGIDHTGIKRLLHRHRKIPLTEGHSDSRNELQSDAGYFLNRGMLLLPTMK